MLARTSGGAGLAVVLLGVACTRPPAQTEGPPTPAAPRPPAPRPQHSREARVEHALARAPQLSRAAAEMLADSSERRGGVWGDPADQSLIEANRGFAQMPREDLAELGGLFGEAYASLSAADRATVESYVERVRRGDATDADERARTLLGDGVRALPADRLGRLQALLESAIRAGLATEERTARALRETPPSPPARAASSQWARARSDAGDTLYHRPSQGTPPAPDHEAEESRLRALGAAYKSQLEGLESNVRYAERAVESAQRGVDQARETPLNQRPLGDPEVAAAERRLADAREALQRARNALDDLHTKIRRERIPLSYVQ